MATNVKRKTGNSLAKRWRKMSRMADQSFIRQAVTARTPPKAASGTWEMTGASSMAASQEHHAVDDPGKPRHRAAPDGDARPGDAAVTGTPPKTGRDVAHALRKELLDVVHLDLGLAADDRSAKQALDGAESGDRERWPDQLAHPMPGDIGQREPLVKDDGLGDRADRRDVELKDGCDGGRKNQRQQGSRETGR